MHRLNLHLSANSSLIISLLVFLSTSGYFSGGHLSDLSKSLLETFLLISYSSFTLVFHTEDNLQNCLLISVRHTPIQTKSPLGNNKNIQIILKQGIHSGLYWEQLYIICFSCWLQSTGSSSNEHFILMKVLLGVLQQPYEYFKVSSTSSTLLPYYFPYGQFSVC